MMIMIIMMTKIMIIMIIIRPKKKLFVSCYPTLTRFYSKKIPTLNFFLALTTPNQRKTCIKHTFVTQK